MYEVFTSCHGNILILGGNILILGSDIFILGGDIFILGGDIFILGGNIFVLGGKSCMRKYMPYEVAALGHGTATYTPCYTN